MAALISLHASATDDQIIVTAPSISTQTPVAEPSQLVASAEFTMPESLYRGTILEGIIDLPRLKTTGPIDGCSTVQEGIMKSGGFLLFTCEKLRYGQPIEEQEKAFDHYQDVLAERGWEARPLKNKSKVEKAYFVRAEDDGCETHLELALWKDRTLNERGHDKANRKAFRQIMFMARFPHEACKRYYPHVQAHVRGEVIR